MLIRSVWVVHYESNSTKGWSYLHCIVSVITGCSVLGAGSCWFPAGRFHPLPTLMPQRYPNSIKL